MAQISTTIDDGLDTRFRNAIHKKLGFKRGNYQIAIEQALEGWIKT